MLLVGLTALGQQTARIMSYNLLNFLTGNLAGREDTLRTIIDHVRPDLFLIQELKNDIGLQLIVQRSFDGLPGNYEAATFLPQQSGSGGFKLQQSLVYNADLFGLLHEGHLMTAVRDINRYQLYWKDPMLAQGADTVKLWVFVAHLKSSQGSSNVEARLAMVQTFTTHLQLLPPNVSVVFAGDLNVYTSTEPAYQKLMDESNAIVMRDPIDSPGNWHSSSFVQREIHTQSTRQSSIFDDGAGGGMDDRFDFILLSENMFSANGPITYVTGSYHAPGNDGSCYDQSITSCGGGDVPYEMIRAMYHMSDHLPVVLDLQFNSALSGSGQEASHAPRWRTSERGFHLVWNEGGPVTLQVFDMLGREVFRAHDHSPASERVIPMPWLGNGMHLIRLTISEDTIVGRLWNGVAVK